MERRIVTIGAVGGAVGAVVMAIFAMIAVATYQHTGFFTPCTTSRRRASGRKRCCGRWERPPPWLRQPTPPRRVGVPPSSPQSAPAAIRDRP
jgi:hypothetical protein